jgi:hypothetical protein
MLNIHGSSLPGIYRAESAAPQGPTLLKGLPQKCDGSWGNGRGGKLILRVKTGSRYAELWMLLSEIENAMRVRFCWIFLS